MSVYSWLLHLSCSMILVASFAQGRLQLLQNFVLQKAVMEAVTTLIRGGLRVGMILHGKKLRDDSKTLLQTGISHDNELDALGFTLEPNSSSQSLPLICAKDFLHVPSADTPRSLIG